MSAKLYVLQVGLLAMSISGLAGCAHWNHEGTRAAACGDACQADCSNGPACGPDCKSCGRCGGLGCGPCWLCGWLCCHRSNAIPATLPLGSTVRAHYQVMETNAEAADFIFHRHDFVGDTAQLTPDGRDKVLEIAARMKSAPFPVLIERSETNADPELDQLRRNLIAHVLTEFGSPDAERRTVVAPAYGPGYNAIQGERTYYQYLFQGGGFGGGFGGGGFGGGGFGGGGFAGGGFGGGGF
jgi:uncharacterized membrane protein YgcG